MNKKERLEKIRRFVTDYQIGTQEEIVEYLKEAGITATQATVSRDIKELGIVKIPLRDNTYVYELPKSIVKSLQLAEDNIEFLAYLKKEESASNQVLAEIEEVVERAHSQFKNE